MGEEQVDAPHLDSLADQVPGGAASVPCAMRLAQLALSLLANAASGHTAARGGTTAQTTAQPCFYDSVCVVSYARAQA